MFSFKVSEFIEKMGMDPDEYYDLISLEFNNSISIFEDMILFFMIQEDCEHSEFYDYVNNKNINNNVNYFESLFELFSCLELFIPDGKLNLYKFKQAEWNLPQVVLKKSDFPVIDAFQNQFIEFIYRGMSRNEFDSGNFGQSWTYNLETACDFSKLHYNQPDGLVVKTSFNKGKVLHIAELPEFEVIVEQSAIKKSFVEIVL